MVEIRTIKTLPIEAIDFTRVYELDSKNFSCIDAFIDELPVVYNANRLINPKHVDELVSEIVDCNGDLKLWKPFFVDVNTRSLPDGNHTILAAIKALKEGKVESLKLYFIFKDIPSENFDELVVVMNNKQKNWESTDYIHHFSLRNYTSHQKFEKFAIENGFTKENKATHELKINPAYAAAALGIDRNKLKKASFTLSDEQIADGVKTAKEAAVIISCFDRNKQGGWIDVLIKAWRNYRDKTDKNFSLEMSVEAFLDKMQKVKNKQKNKSNSFFNLSGVKKSDFMNFFIQVSSCKV